MRFKSASAGRQNNQFDNEIPAVINSNKNKVNKGGAEKMSDCSGAVICLQQCSSKCA